MNVEELIDLAVFNVQYASDNTAFDQAERAVCAATAQAAAATAQAMMMAQMTATGENVTTGETIRWLRVDTGN